MKSKLIWCIFLYIFCSVLTISGGNLSDILQKKTVKRKVYFPALPDSFDKEFGLKVTESSEESTPKIRKNTLVRKSLAVRPHKEPETPGSLPLAQESHVVDNSVTEPPGPSYLTESVYYHGEEHDQPTPAPGFRKKEQHPSSFELSEKENFQGLRSISSPFSENDKASELTLELLKNPALLYYIPTNEEETIKATKASSANTSLEDSLSTIDIELSKTSFSPSTLVTTVTDKPMPEIIKSPSVPSTTVRYKPLNTASSQRIRKTSTRPSPKLNLEVTRRPTSQRRTKSQGYLPKPAPNPFLPRLSASALRPTYKASSTSQQPPLTTFPEPTRPPRTSAQEGTITTTKVSPLFDHFGRRMETKTVEVYRSPSTKKQESIDQRLRHFNFGFDSAAGSAPQRQYKTPSRIRLSSGEKDAPVYRTPTKSYRAPTSLYQVRNLTQESIPEPVQPDFVQTDSNIYVPQEYNNETIPGQAGIDYPVYSRIPDTKFHCGDQAYPGLYADKETGCQVFHICQEGGREDSFLCPRGTVFNQQYFVCDWWYNFSCDIADTFYSLNALIYELPEEPRLQNTYSQ